MMIVINAKPNAKQTKAIVKLDERTFVIALRAPAVQGKANEELIAFLSKTLKIPKSFINLKRGHVSRIKHLEIPDHTNLNDLLG